MVAAVVVLSKPLVPSAQAAEIQFSGGEPQLLHYQSDEATPIPTDGSFKFEVGVFLPTFVPTSLNKDEWLTNWRPIANAAGEPIPGATTDFTVISTPFFGDFDGFNSTLDLDHNNPPHSLGTQGYIWGFNNRTTAGSAQWILLTHSTNWTIPDGVSPLTNTLNWTIGTSDDSDFLVGSRNGLSMIMGNVTIGGVTGPLITIDDQNTDEDSGTVVFNVGLSESAQSATTVDYSVVAVTAQPGADFTVDSGTLTIDAGNMSEALAVQVSEDNLDEADETFRVVLTNPQGATLSDSEGVGTIVDNDPPPEIAIAPSTAYENSGTLQIPFTLSAPSSLPISATVVSGLGNLIEGDDVTILPTTVNFAPGETMVQIAIGINDDTIPEVDKVKSIGLQDPINAVFGSTGITSGITILDDDALTQLEETGSLSFNAATGDMTISWDAVSGRSYHVMFTTDLINWTLLPGAEMLDADSSNASFIHADAGANRGFYKIVNGYAPQ